MTGHGRRRRVPPHQPLYADQKVLGVTLSARVKAILVLVVVVLFLGSALLLSSISSQNARHDQAARDRAAQNDAIAQNRQAIEVAFEDTRELACALIAQFPDTLTTPVDVPSVRAKYECLPFGTPPTATLPPFTGSATPSVTPSASRAPVRTTGPGSSPRASPAISAPRTVVAPTPTVAPTTTAATATPTAGVLAPLLTPVCVLVTPLLC